MVPISEDSKTGGRLEPLATTGLILRYPHADLEALGAACEKALALPDAQRKRIYEHFNRHETIGTVVAEALAGARSIAAAITRVGRGDVMRTIQPYLAAGVLAENLVDELGQFRTSPAGQGTDGFFAAVLERQ